MSQSFMEDPLWYKDAVIYETHVRSFFDSNDDGYGDFEGLRRKLYHIESLGVNTIWLLPFLESPLRDDGYDISDYYNILPIHGTLDDFKRFLNEAHERGIRVITELVLNHTSDQNPWFQEARDPNSPKHDWYVWSDTTEKYEGARIIFTDTEISNWTWDRKAGKYYWHRFFSHQPDLNYDNPEVRRVMRDVMFYWLDLGVDGLRLDAVPYLFEREGTNCENLPETIEYIKELRRAIEERYGPGKVLLAEANQWPEDTLPYFANGEGVHMSFNFPIMPRMYMALRRESRHPLVQMLELTKDIPEECQWAIFLRNHDELTLEMVTDEERDYMYHEYATDQRFRINVGIRRRLAPLLGGERRRIELMNALLLSLKGSPVLYYGDEVGMGDDPFLGDRNGVRTPMQWSPDKNGGFSRSPHHQLFMPTISRGPYSYEFVNVEDAERDPHSLLNFTKRILALRKQYVKVFGRGTIEILPVENHSVLAFVREYEGEKILVVANLSRFAQSAFLPVQDRFSGLVPVELFSKSPFPAFGDQPYHFLIGPHGFYWFVLQKEEAIKESRYRERIVVEESPRGALQELFVREGIHNLLVKTMTHGRAIEQLETLLVDYVKDQRWFGAKNETIERVEIADAVRIQSQPFPVYLSVLGVTVGGRVEYYILPLMLSNGEAAQTILKERSRLAIAYVQSPDGRGLLHDATVSPDFWKALFAWWQTGGKGRSLYGLYAGSIDRSIATVEIETARPLTAEQSNSSAILNDRFFIKLYRRVGFGINPETELLEYLTRAGFPFVPRLYGMISFKRMNQQSALGILQEALPFETDGWNYALEMNRRFLDRVAGTTPPENPEPPTGPDVEVPVWLEEVAPEMLSLVRTLGTRTAELHLALSKADQAGMRPVETTPEDVTEFISRLRSEVENTREMLAPHSDTLDLPDNTSWSTVLRRLDGLLTSDPVRQKIRVHGDYHLGQVMMANGEFYILDFEGEPARPIEERRSLSFALRDVAGMLRSIEYAALAAWQEKASSDEKLEEWMNQLIHWCEREFLEAYYGTAEESDFAQPSEARQSFLWVHLLEKALYEVRYELNHRPSWAWLPVRGLHRLLQQANEKKRSGSAKESR